MGINIYKNSEILTECRECLYAYDVFIQNPDGDLTSKLQILGRFPIVGLIIAGGHTWCEMNIKKKWTSWHLHVRPAYNII